MELQFHSDPARKPSANLYDIYHCCVYSEKTPEDGQRNFPKYVEFHSKNKFEKLVHLVGFILRICQAAKSYERKKNTVPRAADIYVALIEQYIRHITHK